MDAERRDDRAAGWPDLRRIAGNRVVRLTGEPGRVLGGALGQPQAHALRGLPGRVLARARRAVRIGRLRWRRSLLLRVVAATVALGLVVVLVVGQFLLERISSGLVDSRMATAQG